MNQEYNFWSSASLAFLGISVIAATILIEPLVTGVCLTLSYLAFSRARKISNLEGKTDFIKLVNSFTPNLVLFSALLMTILFSPQTFIVGSVIALTGFTEAFKGQLKIKKGFKGLNFFEQREKVFLLSLLFILTSLNPYWMFYGLIFFLIAGLLDFAYGIYRISR